MAGVSFTLSLIDKLSSPAKASAASLDQLTAKAKGLSTQMGGLETSMGSTGSGAAAATPQIGNMTQGIAGAGAAATMAAAAIGVAVAAIGALVVSGASLALEMTEAREKILATLTALSGSPAAGQGTLDLLDSMRAKLGMTTAELAPLAENLMKMGIQGDALKTQLTALASVKAISGDAGVDEYNNILKKISASAKLSTKDLTALKDTGVNVNDMAAKMGVSVKQLQAGLKAGTVSTKDFGAALTGLVTAKGMGPMEQQANSFSAQLSLLKENIGKLFDGIDAGPFLAQLKSLFGLFDQNTASGKTMKVAITGFFNETFAIAAKVLPFIKNGIEQMIIAGLKAYISMKPLIASFKEWLTTGGGIDTIVTTLKGVGVVLAAIAVGAAVMIAPFVAAGIAITAVGVGLAWLLGKIVGFVPAAVSALSSFASAGATMASGFISGLVSGITAGIGAAVGAVTNLGGSLLAAAKSLIPGMGGGAAAPGGAATGGGAAPIAAKANAVGGVVQPANGEVLASVAPGETIVPAGMANAPGGVGRGGGTEININVNVGGGTGGGQADAQQMGQIIAEQVALVFEKIGLSGGAAMA